jgi:hypothetical protein
MEESAVVWQGIVEGWPRVVVFSLLSIVLVACGGSLSVEDLAATLVVETSSVIDPEITQQMSLTQTAERAFQLETQSVMDTHAAGTAEALSENTAIAAEAATSGAATALANTVATAQARPFAEVINDLVVQGYLTRGAGTYHSPPNYNASYATGPAHTDFGFMQMISYSYFMEPLEYSPADFVIRADVTWDNYDENANKIAGCGFALRINERTGDHYLVWFSGMGHINHIQKVNQESKFVSNVSYANLGWPRGNAELMLVVQGDKIIAFVNGEHVQTRQAKELTAGRLAYAILSGDSRGFGTRCQMKNVDLWILD